MQAIVVTFDRLATRLIGCYGNEWIETPHLDRLAATSTVFDNHFTDSVGSKAGQAWFTGRLAHSPSLSSPSTNGLPFLRQWGVTTELVIAASSRLTSRESAGFDRVAETPGEDGLEVDPKEVPIARLIQAGISLLREPAADGNRLVWLHAPEPGLPPEGFATLYFEDFEERELPMTDVPREAWPQELAVAAGSLSLVDHWIGELISQIRLLDQPTLLVITAARGQSWMNGYFAAEPSVRTSSPADLLRDQEVKTPLILSVHGAGEQFADFSGLRCPHFVQTTDLIPTLFDWFGVTRPSELAGVSLLKEAVSVQSTRREIQVSDDDRNLGIRTPEWHCLVRLADANGEIPENVCFGDAAWPEQVQLFSKPEDIWDVTDVSTQQPEVCESLVRRFSRPL